ncbi:hypothetical protein AB4Z21_18170 [Paenibacillus sp. MCAF20]
MKPSKTITTLALAVFVITCTGAIVFAKDSFNKFSPSVPAEDAAHVAAVQKRLQKTWENGKNQIINEGKEDVMDWTFTDMRTLPDTFIPTLSDEEKSSFLEAFGEAKSNLDVGDSMPGLLFNPDSTEAKVYWQKKNGSYVSISLKTRINEEGHKMWYVDGNARKLPEKK